MSHNPERSLQLPPLLAKLNQINLYETKSVRSILLYSILCGNHLVGMHY